jgi:phosphosulfolactate synthase
MPGSEFLEITRDGGLTHVIDKGLGPRAWEDVLETSGEYIDIVKLGWGTAYVTPNLQRKLDVLKEKPVVIGGTFFEAVFAPYQWVEWIKAELEAGAWKVITEGREGGTAGIYRPTGEMRTGLVDEIVHEVDVNDLLFEAPTKASQAWFVKQFGPGVNLGNIPPEEVIPLETLRLGLRADTFREVLLGDAEPATP